jgi:hypothetical protein
MANGNVYCFNSFNEPANLNVNSFPASTQIPGWQATGQTIYTPQAIPIPRVKHTGDATAACFGNDAPNPVRIQWVSYTGNTTITIPGSQSSLLDDLIVYLTLNKAILMNTRGFVLDTQDIKLVGMTAAAKEAIHKAGPLVKHGSG